MNFVQRLRRKKDKQKRELNRIMARIVAEGFTAPSVHDDVKVFEHMNEHVNSYSFLSHS